VRRPRLECGVDRFAEKLGLDRDRARNQQNVDEVFYASTLTSCMWPGISMELLRDICDV